MTVFGAVLGGLILIAAAFAALDFTLGVLLLLVTRWWGWALIFGALAFVG